MKNKKHAFKNLFILCVLTIVAVACDKDFISLDSDISGGNNFGVSDEKYEVIAYNKKLGPVQTNNLPSNLLGFYKDEVYGSTTANLVTQLSPTTMDPTFPEETRVDSVVVTIPYFSTSKGIEDGKTKYKLDSVFGTMPISLKIYENNYFLRSFDPNSGFDTPQKYYSDRSTSASNQIPLASLQGTLLAEVEKFLPSNKEIKLKHDKDSTLLAPALRLKLDNDFWHNKIVLKGGEGSMAVIDLFGGTNIDTNGSAATEFEIFKNAFVETDDKGKFVKSKRLINEANLVFYVDQALMKGQEPDRILIYDAKNKTVLLDYLYDNTDTTDPNNLSKINHLGKLQRVSDDKDAKGVKYKIKITEHIKNLLTKDSTNISLGLVVSLNVNEELNNEGSPRSQNSILSPENASVSTLPVSSILSPKGTILYGNNTNDPNKKLYLEIFYTEPNN